MVERNNMENAMTFDNNKSKFENNIFDELYGIVKSLKVKRLGGIKDGATSLSVILRHTSLLQNSVTKLVCSHQVIV